MNKIQDVDTEYNANLVAGRLIAAAHNDNDPLSEYLNKLDISSDAFVDIVRLGLAAVEYRESLFRQLRNHYVMVCDESL